MNSDSYYEPPEPSPSDVLEAAEWEADQVTAEWATVNEMEVHIDTGLSRANEPVFTVSAVRRDGELLYGGVRGTTAIFDTSVELRDWLIKEFPLDPEW